MIFYNMLTGEPPFANLDGLKAAWDAAVERNRPPIPRNIDEALAHEGEASGEAEGCDLGESDTGRGRLGAGIEMRTPCLHSLGIGCEDRGLTAEAAEPRPGFL